MLPKVSVVVPIYKVEKYLKRCIESIMDQTYPNLEIIFVNDGSPDKCGDIIEDYAKKDKRIQTVHKKNGGLSDARNAGMKFVTGDFTVFVDSDDWIKKDMIEKQVNTSLMYRADIVQSAFYYAYENHLLYDNRYLNRDDDPVLLNNAKLMKELVINNKVKNFAWGKLYKTDLIKNTPFKKGVLFEDVFWAHTVMQKVNTFVIINEPLYYYLQREDSIVANYSLKNLDMLEGLKERHRFMQENYKELINDSYKAILSNCLIHYNLLFLNNKIDKKGTYRQTIRQYIKKNAKQFSEASKHETHLKWQLKLFLLHPLLNISYLTMRKGLRKLKVLKQPPGLERINL